MPRASRESATAKGITPPAAIKPMGDEASTTGPVMVCAPGVGSSTLLAGLQRLAQLAIFSGIDEAEDFRDRGVRIGEMPDFGEPLCEHARAVKQPLIKRPDGREPLAGELATSSRRR